MLIAASFSDSFSLYTRKEKDNRNHGRKRKIRFIHSIAFQSTFILVSALVLIGGMTAPYFSTGKSDQIQEQTFQDNHGSLKRAMASIQSGWTVSKAGSPCSRRRIPSRMDPSKPSSFLKASKCPRCSSRGNMSPCTTNYANSRTIPWWALHYPEFNDFSKVLAQRPSFPRSSGYKVRLKFFAVIVENRATATDSSSRAFSFRRLWTHVLIYKAAEKSKYFVLFNSDGTILYHPDLKRWINTPHSAEDLGLQNSDPMHYTVTRPHGGHSLR